MRKHLVALALAVAAIMAVSGVAWAATSYEDIKLHGQVMRDQLNQVRSPDAVGKYFLYKVADTRAQEAVDRYAATGNPSGAFVSGPGYSDGHDLRPVIAALEANDVCYNWVGENIGQATLRTSPPAATADDIMDLWEASSSHNSIMKNPSVDWTGGGYVQSHFPGYYYFVMYVVDVCGI